MARAGRPASAGRWVLAALLALALVAPPGAMAQAQEPDRAALTAAIEGGDFSGYFARATAWIDQKALAGGSGKVTADGLKALLKDPAFACTLAQRQFLFKTGVDKLGAFARAEAANRAFLGWLMTSPPVLDLFLEAVVPVSLAAREKNAYAIPIGTLELWRKIVDSDPDAREGLCLKLAMATAISPPGTSSPGAGQPARPSDPLVRYRHYQAAHRNKELFPSFDKLTVWEMTKVVSSNASEEDLAWGRAMINAWRPDLRVNELVVNSTSEVWRRSSPHPYTDYKSVLSGGGKCGPRSSWSVFICQAFGVPAIGVGQPAHACVAYKAANPMTEPQPGSAWKVGYGRGWQVSKLEGMSGTDFLAGVQDRERPEFPQVERLRWIASSLASPACAAAVMDIAREIQNSAPAPKTDITASHKPEEAEKEAAPDARAAKPAALAGPPIQVGPGTTEIDAASVSGLSAVRILPCHSGGRQVNFDKNLPESWIEYTIESAQAGTYLLEIKVAVANLDQVFTVKAGQAEPVTIKLPCTTGLWGMTAPAEIALAKGRQTLRISAPNQRGVAVRCLTLKAPQTTGAAPDR